MLPLWVLESTGNETFISSVQPLARAEPRRAQRLQNLEHDVYENKSTVTTFALADGGSAAAAPGGGGRGGGACCLVLRAYPPCAGANAGVKRRRWSYLSAWLPSAPAPRRAAALLVLTLGQTSEPARAEVIVGVHENGARSPTGSIEASGPVSRSPEFRRRFPGETVEDELLLRPDGPPPL